MSHPAPWARGPDGRDLLVSVLRQLERPRPLWPLLLANVAGFYTGIIAAAVVEQRYKEAYWEEHPGAAVPVMRSRIYLGKDPFRPEDQ